MEREPLRVFDCFEKADRAYYASLPPQERLDVMLKLIRRTGFSY